MKKIVSLFIFTSYCLSIFVMSLYVIGYNALSLMPFFTGLISLTVFATAFAAMGYFGFHGTRGKTICLLTVGFVFTTIGDLVVLYSIFSAGNVPFSPLFNGSYLFASLCWFTAVVNELVAAHISWNTLRASTKKIIITTASVSIAVILFVSFRFIYHAELSTLENITRFGYMVSDVALLITGFCLLFLIREYKGGKLARTWIFLFLSFVLKTIADILMGVLSQSWGPNFSIVLRYAVYMGSYVFLSYTFVSLISAVRQVRRRIQQLPLGPKVIR